MITHSLDELRAEIDTLDENILQLLSRRFSVVTEIGIVKHEQKVEILDNNREAKIYKRLKRLAAEYGLPYGIEKQLWEIIMTYSKESQATKQPD
jgi:chorismate mutase